MRPRAPSQLPSRERGRRARGRLTGLRGRGHRDSPVNPLDPKAVLGLFTWSDTSPWANSELAIEFSRWGVVSGPNAQCVVQPFSDPGHLWRYRHPAGVPQSTHSFTWQPDVVYCESLRGHDPDTFDPNALLQQWLFNDGIPVPPGRW